MGGRFNNDPEDEVYDEDTDGYEETVSMTEIRRRAHAAIKDPAAAEEAARQFPGDFI